MKMSNMPRSRFALLSGIGSFAQAITILQAL